MHLDTKDLTPTSSSFLYGSKYIASIISST